MVQMVDFDSNSRFDFELDDGNGYEVRDYQEFGTKFLSAIRRAFLTDEPGLGKTPQAIKATELPAMVVCPAYLKGQWEEAILREHPDAIIANADGTRRNREQILGLQADWYIVNYSMLPTFDLPTGIRTFINDESHHLRHERARHSKVARIVENDVVNKGCRIYNLTATPFWKTVADIWMQADILYPGMFGTYRNFVKLYFTSLQSPYDGPKIIRIRPKMRADLKRLLSPIMLGRTYDDVGRFLPPIIESNVTVNLSPNLRAIYKKLVKDFSIKWESETERERLIFNPTTVLHTLRQVTMVEKHEPIQGIIEDNDDKPAVIGLWYRDHALEVYNKLPKGYAVLITGNEDPTERQRRAMWAQQNGKGIVATISSLMEGVNLNKYRIFIFGEEHYVPGTNHQFLSRVVRDRNDGGLDRSPVRVFYVGVRDSIDVHIHKVSRDRKKVNQATRELLERTFKET